MFDEDKIKNGIRMILEGVGEDPDRQGLIETPDRVARMYKEIFSSVGLRDDSIEAKIFRVDNSNIVIERDITFYSMCEHHLLPFYGRAAIAYISNEYVIGLSKLARIVEFYSRKPQLQERLTEEIAAAVSRKVNNKGVFVHVVAEHLCVNMRGVKKPGTSTVSVSKTGDFLVDRDLCNDVVRLIKEN